MYIMKCEKCGFATEFKGALSNHIKSCGRAKPTCDKCGKISRTQRALDSHQKICTEMFCDKCGKEFISIPGKKAHMKFCPKPPKPTEFPCEICERVFTTKRGLTLHTSMRKTPCNREYKCFHCDFKTRDCNKIFRHSKQCTAEPAVGILIEI